MVVNIVVVMRLSVFLLGVIICHSFIVSPRVTHGRPNPFDQVSCFRVAARLLAIVSFPPTTRCCVVVKIYWLSAAHRFDFGFGFIDFDLDDSSGSWSWLVYVYNPSQSYIILP
jgi:hypothetical protein